MRLALFFTRSVGLHTWVENGLFDREKLIYERHLADGTLTGVIWLTYQSCDAALAYELYAAGRLDRRIEIRGRPRWFPGGRFGGLLYSILMPLIHARTLLRVDLCKTNQLDGGWAAVIARWLYRKPLLLRCGYVQSKLETSLCRLPTWRLRLMTALERFQYRHADLALVASEHDARYVQEQHALSAERIRCVPNYIDEMLFAPDTAAPLAQRPARLLYVGRLSAEKNLEALIRAAAYLAVPLDLVGRGPIEERLRSLVAECGAMSCLLGAVPNKALPEVLNQYAYFVLPSYFEGMPKTLLEAMACGLVCVGTDVAGINEIISDGVNGFLASGVDAAALCTALSRAMTTDHERVGAAARETILARYTLTAVLRIERNIFVELTTCR